MILSVMLRQSEPTAYFLHLLSRAALPAICVLVIGYFGAHAIFGATGVLARADIRAEHARLAAANSALKTEKAALEQDIALLDPKAVDPDYADELVRRHLGVVRPDEVIVPIGPSAP